ncbi:MAG: polymer-forming cytoskeletal protein [Candidatus Aminicenantia bacterium]
MNKKEKNNDIIGFIDQGTEFNGELKFKGTFRIDGVLKGKVISESTLIVGEKARVEADMEVGNIIINGQVRGSIKAKEKVEIYSKGRVYGNISTPKLVVEEGAFFQATCEMEEKSSEKSLAKKIPFKKD